MDYGDSDRATAVAERTREFVHEEVLPIEREITGSGPVSDATVDELREKAREYDVYAPQIPEEFGGLGLDHRDMLPVFEEAGHSLLGPVALNIGAPDEGNMHLLSLVGTEAQKERWLGPLAAGDIKSGFSMTEPIDGAGSDPKMIQTTAEKDGDEWVIDGHKWWTTQGSAADVLIVFARTDQDAHPYSGCSTFIVPADTPGLEIVRDIPHLSDDLIEMSHSEVRYDGVRVPESNLLGGLHEGFKTVQMRLGPARLTHCMRYTGMATRALEVAKAYASERTAFGEPLSEKQDLRFKIAEAEMRLHAVRTMVRHAADEIAAGGEARIAVSMCKVFAANVVQDTIDTAIQICGGNGIGNDLPLADFYANVRQFRLVDGADEVHKRVIARNALDGVDDSQIDNISRFMEFPSTDG